MFKIGLIGAENSHAEHFADAFNGKKLYGESRATCVFGNDHPEKAAALSEKYSLINCGNLSELFDNCDAVVITYRKGSVHYDAAMESLKSGKAAFIDKPFTTDYGQAAEICDFARKNNLLICGGSNLKGVSGLAKVKEKLRPGTTAVISFSADCGSEYDGYHFYGPHSVEICLELFGLDYKNVNAVKNGETVIVTVTYELAQCVFINAPDTDGLKITLFNKGEIEHFDVPMDYESVGSTELVNMLKTGKPPRDYAFYTTAVKMISGIMEKL